MREKIEETVTETEAIRQKRQEAEEMKKSLIDKLALQRWDISHARQLGVETTTEFAYSRIMTRTARLQRANSAKESTEHGDACTGERVSSATKSFRGGVSKYFWAI